MKKHLITATLIVTLGLAAGCGAEGEDFHEISVQAFRGQGLLFGGMQSPGGDRGK